MSGYRNRLSLGHPVAWAVAAVVAITAGGCGDFIPPESAGIESSKILKDLGRVETMPEPNIPLPAFFKAPPKIIEQTVGGKPEYKLFYFCQHHTSAEMQKIINEQFASRLFDAKGKSTRVVDYGVTANPATNQLIVRCPAREDAEAVLEFLQEVDLPPIQVKISCLISELYADKTLDWETSLAIEDFLGESIWAGPAGKKFGTAIDQIFQEDSIAAFPGGSLRELARAKMGLKVGYLSRRSHKFTALVDMLESQGYLKILMNPTLQVINGQTARVQSSQKVPLTKTYLRGANSDWFESRQEWENVVDSLQITPHVYGDGSIGLETSILLGSKLTPEGIKQLPIITKKQIDNKETRIRPGESLIIGGLRKSEKRDVVRGIPFLKDIPLLGILFSGRDFEERAVETIFILTPTISTGGIPRDEMKAEIRKRHGEAGPGEDQSEVGFDPFGTRRRARAQERKNNEAEQARIEAEEEKAIARHTTREAEDRAKKAEAKAELAKMRSDRIVAEAEKAKAEAQKAKAEAEAKAKAADAAKAAADKASAEAARMMAEATKAIADATAKLKAAEEARAEAAKIAADATKTKQEAQKARAEAEALAKAAEQAKAQAEAKAKAADQARAIADRATADAARITKEAQDAEVQAEAKAKAAEKAEADAEKAEAPEKAKTPAQTKTDVQASEPNLASAEPHTRAESDRPIASQSRRPGTDPNTAIAQKTIQRAPKPAASTEKAVARNDKTSLPGPGAATASAKPGRKTRDTVAKLGSRAQPGRHRPLSRDPKAEEQDRKTKLLALVLSVLTL